MKLTQCDLCLKLSTEPPPTESEAKPIWYWGSVEVTPLTITGHLDVRRYDLCMNCLTKLINDFLEPVEGSLA